MFFSIGRLCIRLHSCIKSCLRGDMGDMLGIWYCSLVSLFCLFS